jgi:hypothetical protein
MFPGTCVKAAASLGDVPSRLARLMRPCGPLELVGTNGAIAHRVMISNVASDLASQRGETWNDTEAINRHREMTPSQRVALAIEASRAALRFANAPRRPGLRRSAGSRTQLTHRSIDEQPRVALLPPLQLRDGDQHELAGEHDLQLRLHAPLEVVEAHAERCGRLA